MLSQKNFAQSSPNGASTSINDSPWVCATVPTSFKKKMFELFVGLYTVRVYTDDLLHVTKGSWTEHLTFLEEMFTDLHKAGLNVNARKSYFRAHKFD